MKAENHCGITKVENPIDFTGKPMSILKSYAAFTWNGLCPGIIAGLKYSIGG